ncbi:RNA-binding domain-containing protein [Macrolepiota fuliginosa MF-IS2]|uniref:RNA-binding domain-containing protein n=1 Tax=Macrolepiota fuliginosa MF-IS2 TaxID=1400762 RepID=A0A9P5X1E6_9AGAR|nr:RNA-binding domain-containing protein [Macrolepiota fuliginosa MF-IS2]
MTLGKRKERDEAETELSEASAPHGSTFFVSNLPYTATSVDLQTLFSDIAPVRSAFVVTEPGTGVSKGVGYVAFSIKEDAEAAYEKISKDGIILAGRKLRVTWAEQKSKHKPKDKDATAPIKKEPKARPPVQKTAHDPAAIRTIVISGLPQALDAKQLWKKVRKYEGAEKVEWPHKSEDGIEDPSVAHVLFSTPAGANNAVTKLHAHVFKSSLLSVTLKKRLENLAKPVNQTKPKLKSKEGDAKATTALAPTHASRLIVRNLPFNITEQDLRAVFLPYGPIHQIHIPTTEVPVEEVKPEGQDSPAKGKTHLRAKGFAFVWMLSKKDAERAIEACNGKIVRAGTAQAMVSDKQKKKKQKRLEKKLKEAGKVKHEEDGEGDGEDEDGAEEDGEEDEKKTTERVIAVDWALSKNKWEEEKAKIEQQAAEDVEMAGTDSEDDEDEDEGSGEESESEDGENIGVHPGDDEDSTLSDNDGDEDDREEPVKPQLPAPEVGTTLFVRNVPFTATEDELRTLFRTYGPLRYARITLDMETGRSRGTGFACFWNKEDADKVIEQSDLLRKETTGNAPATAKKNPFVLPSILTPDPSSSLAQSLVLHGRTLDVVRAVTRDQASKLKEEGEKARQKADKRNMYLLKEGVILPNSPLAQDLAPAELERRTNSYNARRALLKSNPSLYISRTRLSVRQIPTFATERVLRKLALHAVRTFKAEVKEGARNELTPDELTDPPPTVPDDGEDQSNQHVSVKGKRFTGRATSVKQAKIVRQQDRVDAITGKGRSKGYGFLEMHKHSDALRVLRWANSNPGIGPLFEQWYKEELEDFLKAEKAKDVKERDDTRVKRIRDEIENGPAKKGKASLIVEFSIENVQVVQRRSAKQSDVASSKADEPKKRKTRSESPEKKEKTDSSSPQKKRRISVGHEAEQTDSKPKAGQSIGSIIGRKRKERKKKGT